MSYIDKNSNIVVSARMTNEGRRLLSLGLLTFDTFRLGDSNIDYSTLGSAYDITLENIIRAKAENPDLKTPILPKPTSTNSYMPIPALGPGTIESRIQSPNLGFFVYNTGGTITYSANTDTVCHMLQADAVIPLLGITGGTSISVRQSGSYGSNTYEPVIGDLMLVKMSNDELTLPQSQGVIELEVPVPYLWYQVQATSGTLAADDLQIQIDRNFASFPAYGGVNEAQVIFYPLGTGGTQNRLFSDGGYFSGGCVWNMNNVWSKPMIGTNLPGGTYESFEKYGSETYIGSKEYFGYTSEINFINSADTACHLVPSISIIHYTNKDTCLNQSEQKYGQKLYIDTTVPASPKLIMPTLMWHKDYSGNTIGHIFSGSGYTQYVTLLGNNTTVSYTNLVDNYGNSVGRIFPELHMFTIHDQELVAALSYKSNRNWTLPTTEPTLGLTSDGVIDATSNLYVTYMLESTSGYTSGLHCQNITCVNFDNATCSPLDVKQVNVDLPSGQFPFMKVSGGTGWYADKFYILAQKVGPDINNPNQWAEPTPNGWKLMDYTSDIVGHTPGTRINPINLENTTFNISQTDYTNGTNYVLNDFIKIPTSAESEYLQFGDERFMFGNMEAIGVTDKYRTKFIFTIPPTDFNTSTNPTWDATIQPNVHIDEVCVYDVNKKLVAVGKMNLPIEKVPNATIIIEVSFDL